MDGNIVIPAGTTARGTVVDAEPLGKLKGGALLELKLTSITVNENGVPITTSVIRREQKGKGKRTAAMAGGGAGTAGAAYTGNNDIVLPAESALSFRLKSPLQVNPAN